MFLWEQVEGAVFYSGAPVLRWACELSKQVKQETSNLLGTNTELYGT